MRCERCLREVLAVQRRYGVDIGRDIWVCMRCAPHEGVTSDAEHRGDKWESRRVFGRLSYPDWEAEREELVRTRWVELRKKRLLELALQWERLVMAYKANEERNANVI
jgi:hypothetical protein